MNLHFYLLAFGFVTPWMLWGMALASLPVIVHLLHKRNYQEVNWAAMQFLLQATHKNNRRIRLEQLLLLIMRILILLLLASSLAEPYVESLGLNSSSHKPVQNIIVIDASYSMGVRSEGISHFDRAKSIATQIVESSRKGDMLHLVRISETQPFTIVRQPAFQPNPMKSEIGDLKLTSESSNVAYSLQTVQEIIAEDEFTTHRNIYLISDFQHNSWLPESSVERSRIQEQLKQLAESAQLIFIDVGKSELENIAIVKLSVAEPYLAVNQPINLQVTIRADGGQPRVNYPVELWLNGKVHEVSKLDLNPGVPSEVEFNFSFDSAGEHTAEVRIPEDNLPTDNRRFISLPVKRNVRVLLVNGRPAGRPKQQATYFLERVLSPTTTDNTNPGFINPIVISEGELSATNLNQFDCICLCNIGLFTKRESLLLEQYVRGGGNILFFLGNKVQADNYNSMLFQNGKGLLPAKLGERIGNSEDPKSGFAFDSLNFQHPIVKPFSGNPGTGFESTLTFEYVRAMLPENSPSHIAVKFNTNDPAIIDSKFGKGRVLLITTSADTQWGLWAVQRSFPPMIHEMIKHIITNRWQERNHQVNDIILRSFPSQSYQSNIKIKRPDHHLDTVALTVDKTQFAKLLFNNTTHPGIYHLELGSPIHRTELHAVNINTKESLLKKLSEPMIQQSLVKDSDYHYQTDWREINQTLSGQQITRGLLSRWMLIAMTCLLCVEQLMAWKFNWGFLLLYMLVSAVFLTQTFMLTILGGFILSLVLSSILLLFVFFYKQSFIN